MIYPRIKDLRIDADLTQAEIAEKLGLYTSQYQVYERGEVSKMPFEFIIDLAKFHNVSLEYLAGLINNPIKLSEIQEIDKKRKSL